MTSIPIPCLPRQTPAQSSPQELAIQTASPARVGLASALAAPQPAGMTRYQPSTREHSHTPAPIRVVRPSGAPGWAGFEAPSSNAENAKRALPSSVRPLLDEGGEIAAQFNRDLRSALRQIRQASNRLCREPVCGPALKAQADGAIRVAGACKAWVLSQGFVLEPQSPHTAKTFLEAAQDAVKTHGTQTTGLVMAMCNLARALIISPRDETALRNILWCAETLSAKSTREYQNLPKDLLEAQWLLERRQKMVDQLTGAP